MVEALGAGVGGLAGVAPGPVRLLVSGPMACFTRPELKVERVSYEVITPSAARGMLEAVYWKPEVRWHVERIHVLNPIRFQCVRRNEVASKVPTHAVRRAMRLGSIGQLALRADQDRQQRTTTLLAEVRYVIEARLGPAGQAGSGDSLARHQAIFARRAARGQCFQQPSLGVREFPARFELLEGPVPRHGLPADQADKDLGLMLLDIRHAATPPGRGHVCGEACVPEFFQARLRDGVLEVPRAGRDPAP